MKPLRPTISALMGLVVLAAVGVMGLREGTAFWAAVTVSITMLALLIGSVNALFRRGKSRAGWVGFVLFGWLYLAFHLGPLSSAGLQFPSLMTGWGINELLPRLHPQPEYEIDPTVPQPPSAGTPAFDFLARPIMRLKPGSHVWEGNDVSFHQVGHSLSCLFVGAIGMVAARRAWERGRRDS